MEDVPGFFVDQFTIPAVGGTITLTNVPIVVLDVPNPAQSRQHRATAFIGTNLLAGRNVVIDPNPATGGGGVGPSLYISDPVTTQTQLDDHRVPAATWDNGRELERRAAPDIAVASPTCDTCPAAIKPRACRGERDGLGVQRLRRRGRPNDDVATCE